MIDMLLCHPPCDNTVYGMTLPTLQQYLKSKGFTVVILEASKTNQEILSQAERYDPRFIGISVPFTRHAPSALNLLHYLKQHTDTPIVVGGTHVTLCPEEFPEADYLCQGYGEQYLLGLLSGMEPCPGVDMDDLPCVLSRMNTEVLPSGVRCMRYMSSRGCVFNCYFCPGKLLSKNRVLYRSVEKVVEDIKTLCEQGFDSIVFCDETFTLDKERVRLLCETLILNDVDVRWWCQTRANLVDIFLLRLMKQAGCMGISFGVESGDPSILKESSKGITLDDICKGIKLCHAVGLLVYGGFIIGHPNDTMSSVENSICFACDAGFDFASFGLMMPFPCTKVRELALLDGGIRSNDWSRYHAGELLYVPPGLTDVDMKRMVWVAHGRFYLSGFRQFWLGWMWFARQSGWRSKADFIRRLLYGVMG